MPPQINEVQQVAQVFTPYGEVPKPEGGRESVTAPPPQANPGDDVYSQPVWSWGACMFGPFFLIAIRKYWYLLLYLLHGVVLFSVVMVVFWLLVFSLGLDITIPLLIVLIILGIAVSFLAIPIYFGIKGRVLASQSRTFANRDQYIGFMKVIDHAGKVLFFIVLVVNGVTLLIVANSFLLATKNFSSPQETYPTWPSSIRE